MVCTVADVTRQWYRHILGLRQSKMDGYTLFSLLPFSNIKNDWCETSGWNFQTQIKKIKYRRFHVPNIFFLTHDIHIVLIQQISFITFLLHLLNMCIVHQFEWQCHLQWLKNSQTSRPQHQNVTSATTFMLRHWKYCHLLVEIISDILNFN